MDLFTGTKPEASVKHSFLFKNNSTPSTTSFTDVTSTQGEPINTKAYYVQGSGFFDFDNDGDLDLFTNTVTDAVNSNPPSVLYENSGAPNFTYSQRATIALDDGSGTNEGKGVAFADVNHDGFLDMVTAHIGKPLLFTNAASGSNKYAFVNLVGKDSTNTSAIGSRVYLTANIPGQNGTTTQLREVSGQTGGGGQNSLRQHFGLGTATKIDSIRAEWLNSSGGSGRGINSMSDLPPSKYYYFTVGKSTVTANIIKSQNFVYLLGDTKSAIEFTTADTDGGSLTVTKTDSDPGGTYDGSSATNPGGSTITPNSVYSDKYWSVTQSGLTGFVSTIYFDASGLTGSPNLDELVLLKRANSGSDWTALNTSRIGNTLYSTGVSSFSEFAIGYEESGVLLQTKIFLQGAYDTAGDTMKTEISGSIPTTSPYSEDPRTVSSIPNNIVDWVLVELRETDSGSAVISKSAFLHKDGRIVNDDASSGVIELSASSGDYYIVIKHRNHLAVMSANKVSLNSSTSVLYDFTN